MQAIVKNKPLDRKPPTVTFDREALETAKRQQRIQSKYLPSIIQPCDPKEVNPKELNRNEQARALRRAFDLNKEVLEILGCPKTTTYDDEVNTFFTEGKKKPKITVGTDCSGMGLSPGLKWAGGSGGASVSTRS